MKENRNYLFKNANIYVDKDGHSYAVDKDGNIIGTRGVSYLLPEITISPKVSTPWEAALLTSKRNPNWRLTYDMSPNLETLNAVTAGVFNWGLSPTTSARILWDAAHGDFGKVGKGIVYGNNGVFSDKYAAKHPWTSLGGNMVLDIFSPLAWGKATTLAPRIGKGIVNEFRRLAALNRLSPVLGSGVPIRNTSDEITKLLELEFSDYLNRKDVSEFFKNADIKTLFKDDIEKFLDELGDKLNNLEDLNKFAEFKLKLLGYTKYSTEEIKNAYDKVINNIKDMTDELAKILGSDEGVEYIKNLINNAKNKSKNENGNKLLEELNNRKNSRLESEASTGEVAAKPIDGVTDDIVPKTTTEVATPEPAVAAPEPNSSIPVAPEPAKPVAPTGEIPTKIIDEVPVTDGTGAPKPDTSTITPVPESSPKPVAPETPLTTVPLTPANEIVKLFDETLDTNINYLLPNGNKVTIKKGTKVIQKGDNYYVKDNFGNKIKVDRGLNLLGEPYYVISKGLQQKINPNMANRLLTPEEAKYLTIKGNQDGTFTFGYNPVNRLYSLYTSSTKPGKASQLWDVLMNRLSKNPTKTEGGVYPEITNRRLGFSAADMPEKGNIFIPGGRQFSIPRTLGSTLGLGYLFGGHKFINNYIQPTAKSAKDYYVGPSENGTASGWNQDITSLEGVPMDTFHVGKDIYGVPNVKFNIKDGEYIQESNGKYYQMYPLREMDNSFTPKGEAIYGTLNSANKYLFPNEANKTKNASQSYTPTNVTKASSLPSVGEDTIQTTLLPQQLLPQQLLPQLKTQQLKNQEIIDLMGFINKTNPLYKIINNYA